MDNTTIITLLLLSGVNAELCGFPKQCKCNSDIGIISCRGQNVTEIPIFSEEERLYIIFLDIIDTLITDASTYKYWKSLEMIIFINNTLLDCDKTPKGNLKLYILMDCISVEGPPYIEHPPMRITWEGPPNIEHPPLKKKLAVFNYKLFIGLAIVSTIILLISAYFSITSPCRHRHQTPIRSEDEESYF